MPSESNLALIAKLKGMIHDCLKDYVTDDEPVAILDFPDIRNCGDSAIWLGEMAYLKDRYGKRPAYVSRMHDFSPEDLERVMPTGPIFIHGGGNFGDVWVCAPGFPRARARAVSRPSDHPVSPVDPLQIAGTRGRERADHRTSQEFRAAGPRRGIEAVRGEALRLPGAPVPRHGLLHRRAPACRAPNSPCLRCCGTDLEKAGDTDRSAYPDIPMEDWITESARRVRIAKALGAASALLAFKPAEMRLRKLDAAAHNRFRRGIRQISRGRAIVTDRLHVHICSLLLGRPHAVLDNSYGKIRRFMSAFSGGTDLSYKATSLDDGIAWARRQAGRGAGQ